MKPAASRRPRRNALPRAVSAKERGGHRGDRERRAEERRRRAHGEHGGPEDPRHLGARLVEAAEPAEDAGDLERGPGAVERREHRPRAGGPRVLEDEVEEEDDRPDAPPLGDDERDREVRPRVLEERRRAGEAAVERDEGQVEQAEDDDLAVRRRCPSAPGGGLTPGGRARGGPGGAGRRGPRPPLGGIGARRAAVKDERVQRHGRVGEGQGREESGDRHGVDGAHHGVTRAYREEGAWPHCETVARRGTFSRARPRSSSRAAAPQRHRSGTTAAPQEDRRRTGEGACLLLSCTGCSSSVFAR